MEQKTNKIPELEVLKEVLENEQNILWYSRLPSFEGPEDSIVYLKEKIKKFKLKYGK